MHLSKLSEDERHWKLAVAQVKDEFDALPVEIRSQVGEIVERICVVKEHIHKFAESVGAREICHLCGGQCCASGKYHFTVSDLLVYLYKGETLFKPNFERLGTCPYFGSTGCLMLPRFRPLNCITFNCDRIEGLIDIAELDEFYRLEHDLRGLYGRLEQLFGNRFQHGLLINYGRDILVDGGRILRFIF